MESFHRLTDSSTLVEHDTFDGIRQAIADAIDARCTGPIATRLKETINFANEPSFRQRVDNLLKRFPAAHVTRLLGDPEEFGQTLRQTRNYFTHPGTKARSKVANDIASLFLMNQKLHALLRYLLLTHWGFPAELVVEPVYYQSRRWRILNP